MENVIPETTANLDETQVLEAPKTTEKVPEVCTETPCMVYSIVYKFLNLEYAKFSYFGM